MYTQSRISPLSVLTRRKHLKPSIRRTTDQTKSCFIRTTGTYSNWIQNYAWMDTHGVHNVQGTKHHAITIDHLAFSDLLGASMSSSMAHAYIKGYNTLIGFSALLYMQNPAALDRHLMAFIQDLHRHSSMPATLNSVRNGIYCVLLIHPHLISQVSGSKRILTKWKNSSAKKSATPLLQPFAHSFACFSIQSGRRYVAVAILCAQAAYLRSI